MRAVKSSAVKVSGVTALVLAGALSLSACGGDDDKSDGAKSPSASVTVSDTSTSETSSASETTSETPSDTATSASSTTAAETTSATGASSVATDLTAADAQKIVRALVDPNTPASEAADLVDTKTPGVAQAVNGLAKGYTAAGYTPDKFTVKSVSGDSATTATAQVEVASPHAPEPVAMPVGFAKVDGKWKLSEASFKQFTSMGSGGGAGGGAPTTTH